MKALLIFAVVVGLGIAVTTGGSHKTRAAPAAPQTPRAAYIARCAHDLNLAAYDQMTHDGAAKSMCRSLAGRHARLPLMSTGAAKSLGGNDAYNLIEYTATQ